MTDRKHYGGFKYRNRRVKNNRGRSSFIGTVITAIAGTVVKDLTSEDSKIKKLFNKMIHPKQISDKNRENKIIDAEYSVIDNEKTEKENSSQLNTEKKFL